MTYKQLQTLEQIRRRGYVCEYDRAGHDGIVRINCVRRWRRGIFSLLVRPDGTYRDTMYIRWDMEARRAI